MTDIRREAPADISAIETITVAAFRSAEHSSGTEQHIVAALRDAGQLVVSLVAEEYGQIVGHVAASAVSISGGTANWYGLGPVSVIPERQGQGLGTLLVTSALRELRTLGAAGCVVLGEPGYYARFGFRPEPGLVLPGVPAQYFQAVALQGAIPSGQVAYHAAFEATA
jgi:predicted N-acetyltransferase YhbS